MRDKLWHLVANDPEIAELDIKLDIQDSEINLLHRLQHEEIKQRLERLGIDTTKFREPPPLHRSEQRSIHHVRDDDDIEELVRLGQETKLDKAYREHLASRSALT